jgi:hypothetical protein
VELPPPPWIDRARTAHLRHHLAHRPPVCTTGKDKVDRLQLLLLRMHLIGDLDQQHAHLRL